MMLLVLLVSLPVGVVLAEISWLVFAGTWFHSGIHQIGANLHEFKRAVGDDARQAALLHSGRMTLQFSLSVLVVLVLLAVIAFIVPLMLAWSPAQQTVYLVSVSVVATAWWLLRRWNRNSVSTRTAAPQAHAYYFWDRCLHWLALEPAVVRHLAFDLERQYALPERIASTHAKGSADPAGGAVYVCGLARSGTTMLLRILDQIDDFRSLTYRDMPFVMAPNLWKRISRHGRKELLATERAHGDGIFVDVDSPEGLEDIFWNTFGTQTPDRNCLGFDEPSSELLNSFADYRALVANPRTEPAPANGVLRRYLSKNNNNLLRLPSLCADPTATVLLVYRNPVATARSLHRQHLRFGISQNADRFTRNYMGWLAHHEFGLDHRPFCFAIPEMDKSYTPDDLNYWLDYWNAVYRQVLVQSKLRFYLVNHDGLRAEPVGTLDAIFAVLGVQADSTVLGQQIAGPDSNNNDGFCPDLLRRAEITHRVLLGSPKNLYSPTGIVRP